MELSPLLFLKALFLRLFTFEENQNHEISELNLIFVLFSQKILYEIE